MISFIFWCKKCFLKHNFGWIETTGIEPTDHVVYDLKHKYSGDSIYVKSKMSKKFRHICYTGLLKFYVGEIYVKFASCKKLLCTQIFSKKQCTHKPKFLLMNKNMCDKNGIVTIKYEGEKIVCKFLCRKHFIKFIQNDFRKNDGHTLEDIDIFDLSKIYFEKEIFLEKYIIKLIKRYAKKL